MPPKSTNEKALNNENHRKWNRPADIEAKYKAAIESIEDGYYEVDIAGNLTFCNDAVLKMLGYSKDEFLGKNNRAYMDKENAKKVYKAFNRVYRTGEPHKALDWELIKKDGTKCSVEISVALLKDTEGKPIGFHGISRDISERRQASEALRISEAKMRSIFRAAPIGIGLVSNRVLLEANAQLCKMTQYTSEALIGKNARFLYPSDDDYEYVGREKYRQIKLYGTGTVETRFRRKDGTIIDVLMSSTPLDLDDLTAGVTFTALDITERKRAKAELQNSEERYRIAVEYSNDGYVLSEAGHVRYVNQRFLEIFGYKRMQDVLGCPISQFVHPTDRPRVLGNYKRRLQDKQAPARYEFKGIRKDGKTVHIEISSTITTFRGNTVNIAYLRDITERRKLEEELRQAHKMESIGTLAGGVAHDFNNILHMIIGNAELALNDLPEWNPAHDNLKKIKSSSLRAAGIVKQLLNFSRKAMPELRPVGIISVIWDALKFLRSTIPANIEISHQLPEQDLSIMADPIQINQVMMNICVNASQAMEETGGTISIEVKRTSRTADAADGDEDLAPGSYVRIAIRDTGPGIDADVIERIFEPYFTTKDFSEGSGMGLAVVHGIVNSHGGSIVAESHPDGGAVFTLLFPLTEEKEAAAAPVDQQILVGTETILFIDDEDSIVTLAKTLLERLGYQVETSMNPKEALERFSARADEIDLVITDMTMPQITGAGLAKEIRKIRADVPIIITTGYSAMMDEGKARELGIDAYVLKPLTSSEISQTIRRVLDAK